MDAGREDRESGNRVPYDYLVNSTGPKLNFGATEGLGPGKNSLSVCTPDHARETAPSCKRLIERMKKGEQKRFVVGTGHGTCTCEGAAFEYVVNLEFELRAQGVRDKAEIIYLSNEYELGDFGMDGVRFRQLRLCDAEQYFHRVALSPNAESTGSRGLTSRKSNPGARTTRRLMGKRRKFHSIWRCSCRHFPAWD